MRLCPSHFTYIILSSSTSFVAAFNRFYSHYTCPSFRFQFFLFFFFTKGMDLTNNLSLVLVVCPGSRLTGLNGAKEETCSGACNDFYREENLRVHNSELKRNITYILITWIKTSSYYYYNYSHCTTSCGINILVFSTVLKWKIEKILDGGKWWNEATLGQLLVSQNGLSHSYFALSIQPWNIKFYVKQIWNFYKFWFELFCLYMQTLFGCHRCSFELPTDKDTCPVCSNHLPFISNITLSLSLGHQPGRTHYRYTPRDSYPTPSRLFLSFIKWNQNNFVQTIPFHIFFLIEPFTFQPVFTLSLHNFLFPFFLSNLINIQLINLPYFTFIWHLLCCPENSQAFFSPESFFYWKRVTCIYI